MNENINISDLTLDENINASSYVRLMIAHEPVKNKYYAVYASYNNHIKVGDHVYFNLGGTVEVGTVVYESYAEVCGEEWTMATILTRHEPIKAKSFARMFDVEWEES